ncbi:MAG: arginine--tRNA ligase [Candidatus Eremiobacteraeota bacterium]|nr:arginine--tRNA ligase [Candidatus Eremiobacteraeota bacterium]
MAPAQTDGLERFRTALSRAVAEMMGSDGVAVDFETPRNPQHGDFATNVAFGLAKTMRRAPQAIATALLEGAFRADPGLQEMLQDASALAGFINVRMSAAYWHNAVRRILRENNDYGRGAPTGVHVSLEFGSANPTGPLSAVQGRTLSVGSTLANTMRFAGHAVTVEWITNDAGTQIDALGRSLYARYRQHWEPEYPFPEDGYPGDYLLPIAGELVQTDGQRWVHASEREWLPFFSRFGRDRIVAEQQSVAESFGAHFDVWQSEKALHDQGAVEAGIARLRAMNLTYERDGALWVRTTEYGDDEDRVVIRSDGRPTYYAGDVAYHYDKFARGADLVIDILGPDHHGYIGRLNALAAAYDHPGGIEVLVSQQMTLKRGEHTVSLSKRGGNIVTLREIMEEVGVDAARFFFVMPSPDSPLTFDLTLAKEQSDVNPVFYVQYGHARIASIERRATPEQCERAARAEHLERLSEPEELALAKRLHEFPRVVRGAVEFRAPHRLTRYAREVAADFHQFYTACRVLVEDDEVRIARLALARATKTILALVLGLAGVFAPESMERLPVTS